MPTPSDDTVNTRTIPHDANNSRNAHIGCPPDEDRERHAPREEQGEDAAPEGLSAAAERGNGLDSDGNVAAQEMTPDRETQMDLATLADEKHPKDEREEHAGTLIEPSSPAVSSPDAPPDSDARLAQSMSNTAISPNGDGTTLAPLYLHFPELTRGRHISTDSTSSFLRPGSKFRGTQQSDRQVYDVQVELKDVDLADSFLCGYLRIQGLTDDHPTLTTFFEGEIVGPKHLFRTAHSDWGSSEKVDLQHWARFPAWRPLAKSAKSNPNYTLRNHTEREHLFMRWKEYFLVPDHRVKSISGASFEGFYYICFNQATGGVSGIYFHAKSEKYQQLELRHVEDKGCLPAVEWR